MQSREQRESDFLTDPAFVLLGIPIELEIPDIAKFSEDGVEDAEIDVVAEVGPDADEKGEVRDCDGRREVVEDFGSLKYSLEGA